MDFPSNSHGSKEPEKREVKRITVSDPIRAKRSIKKRFADAFLGGSDRSVGSYVLLDIVFPAVRDMVSDAVSQGVDRMLYGEGTSRSRSRSRFDSPFGSNTNYSKMSSGRSSDPRMSKRGRATHSFDEIILGSRAEAEEVINELFASLEKYEQVTVAELYTLVGEPVSFQDSKWGWTDLRNAGVSRQRNGYLLDLPRPEPLD